MDAYIHSPRNQRRKHHTPADLLVVRLVRAAMDADWRPASALASLDQADINYVLLRSARARLLQALERQHSQAGQRDLNVLEIAIATRIHP